MKKILSAAIVIILFCNSPIIFASPLDIQAKAAILIDAGSGEVLYEKNAHEKLEEASLTKVMTVLLALEHSGLTEEVTVNGLAFADISSDASSAGLCR